MGGPPPIPRMNVRSIEAGSKYTGRLPTGCVLCRKGAKMVLLITGKCETGCFYCPLSVKKKGRETTYADERKVRNDEDILSEARSIDAQGTGMTGGDPITALDRTLKYIALLKSTFGDKHHIHLYTSSIRLDAYRRLEMAGLDELRIHPPIHLWNKLEQTNLREASARSGMNMGMEIPAIPNCREDLVAVIDYADTIGMDFVNINELEFSETNWRRLRSRGFDVKNEISSAVKGSQELAVNMLNLNLSIPIHYCSSSFKDSIQLRRRIMRRARNVARHSDVITEDGTFLKGVIETRNSCKVIDTLLNEFQVPKKLVHFDLEKRRVEVAPWVLEEIAGNLPYDSYLVEEYPTADRLEVEREQLGSKTKRH
ncbi:MAG: radical SAM protein [Methanomassiliicoccales archaeon]|jgi:pyruvate formate-lyase activating enzyme-like uncharacterized protein